MKSRYELKKYCVMVYYWDFNDKTKKRFSRCHFIHFEHDEKEIDGFFHGLENVAYYDNCALIKCVYDEKTGYYKSVLIRNNIDFFVQSYYKITAKENYFTVE